MKSFRHIEYPLRIYSGPNCLENHEEDLRRQGISRAVIFTGKTLAASPLLELVRRSAGERCVGVYSEVKAHTPRSSVVEAADKLAHCRADAIIVLGGGSAVVTARAASIFYAEGYDLDKLCTRRIDYQTMQSPRLLARKIPLVIMPTTPNTAYVKAGAGIFDDVAMERKAVFDPQTRAQSIFLHPDLLMSAPRNLVVSASLDTLLLAVEGLLSNKVDEMADALLMHAMRLLSTCLPKLAQDDVVDLRADLTIAGILAGRGTDHATAGAATALGHAIGPNYQVENGVAKAALLPHMMRFNEGYAPSGVLKLAASMGIREASDLVERINNRFNEMFSALKLPKSLSEMGIPKCDLPEIAERAMKDWFILGNVRKIDSASELEEVLISAY